MSNKEAIKTLEANYPDACYEQLRCAVDIAIKALEAQDLNKQVTGKLNSADDTISRQTVIEAVEFGITYAKAIDVNTGESKELFKEGNDALKKASERIKDLPSAQPETHEERTETYACDCIERQAAIDAIEILLEQSEDDEHDKTWNNAIRGSINAVKHHVPSAQADSKELSFTHKALDTVSRQAAIEAIKTWGLIDGLSEGQAIEILADEEKLPSAQPLVLTCDGCRHVGTYDTDFPCSGCIRREKDFGKRTASRTTDYRNKGLGFKLNFCPECGRRLDT